jgi:hypothetical protein
VSDLGVVRTDLTGVLVLYGIALAMLVTYAVRNVLVEKFRSELLDAVCSAHWEDFIDLMRQYHQVTRDQMLWPPWKPLQSYYQGTELIARWENTRCR